MAPNTRPDKVLLLDKDTGFAVSMHRHAGEAGIELKQADSLLALGSFAGLQNFDLIIVDLDLDSVRGIEVAQYVEAFFPSIPVVVLRSKTEKTTNHETEFPPCVKGILSKHESIKSIISFCVGKLDESISSQNSHLNDTRADVSKNLTSDS